MTVSFPNDTMARTKAVSKERETFKETETKNSFRKIRSI